MGDVDTVTLVTEEAHGMRKDLAGRKGRKSLHGDARKGITVAPQVGSGCQR